MTYILGRFQVSERIVRSTYQGAKWPYHSQKFESRRLIHVLITCLSKVLVKNFLYVTFIDKLITQLIPTNFH